jgi:hypothetical protein
MVFLCEICGQLVRSGDKSARVYAEMCISDGLGGGGRSLDGDEVVFAVFHAECVSSTYSARECDVVPYISEVRELFDGAA